jgi:hypothetical protein
MSDAIYPLPHLINGITVTPMDRVIKDRFEDGTQQSRRLWSSQYFKRRIEIQHTALTLTEWQKLRSFFAQRGTHDTFWFRDIAERGGNYKVRFSAPLAHQYDRPMARMNVRVSLEQSDITRNRVELDELTTAAGAAPIFWVDPQQQIYVNDGTEYFEPARSGAIFDSSASARTLTGVGGPTYNSLNLFTGQDAQAQYWDLTSIDYVRSDDTGSLGSQPALTIFSVARFPTVSARGVVGAIGTATDNLLLGLQVSSSNYVQPVTTLLAGTWTNARHLNSPNNTYRSYAVTTASASGDVKLYVNGALIGTDAQTRGTTGSKLTFNVGIDESSSLAVAARVGQWIIFNRALSLAEVGAVHNLFASIYGLTAV